MSENKEFHIEATVQSQYAASPHLRALIDSFWRAVNPKEGIDLIYTKMVDVDTAEGFGLDVWGRIVAINRENLAVNEKNRYLGFTPVEGQQNTRLDTMDNAPFYEPVEGHVRLDDAAYRTYIKCKAMLNIGDSTLASINLLVKQLLPGADICCIHPDTMMLRLIVRARLSEADKRSILAMPWLPAGVGLEFYRLHAPIFGFRGSGLHPFNRGTFATSRPVNIEEETN